MNILTKANFRKNKGTSVGLFLLMILSSMMIGVVLLLFLDATPNTENEAKRLKAGDGMFRISGNLTGMDDETLGEIIDKDVEDYEITRGMSFSMLETKFGDGMLFNGIALKNSEDFETRLNRTEIITEDTTITSNYIYLPYQFHTSGGYEIGDSFSLNLPGKKYDLRVRGFLNLTYFGCNNTGTIKLIPDDATYEEIYDQNKETQECVFICYYLKEGVKASKFRIETTNAFIAANPEAITDSQEIASTLFGKTFMAIILAVSFLTVAIIVVLVIMLMLKSSITNYIRENMKSIGALKAIGYTSSKIRRSLYTMFALLAVVAGVLGAGLAYLVIPVMSKIVVGQSGVPYTASFNIPAAVVPVMFVILFTLFVTFLSTRKIKKIEAIVALRDGVENHSFKKNHVKLDKTVFGVNTALAFKTTFTNLKQNLITFFVTGLLVFICVIGLLMYENFNRNPKMEILAPEICSGGITFGYDIRGEVYDFLESRDEVTNIRPSTNLDLTYNGEDALYTTAYEDPAKINNKEVCYEGELPVYDNEICISGKFAKEYGFDIGDPIELQYGDQTYTYLITGFLQSVNNLGKEATMTQDALSHVAEIDKLKNSCYFDAPDEDATASLLDDFEKEFEGKNASTVNFYDVMGGALTTFRSITTVMLILMCIISAVVILLILYLMVRTLIYNKRKDYGIYKALGYTSGRLILQTAVSFMPTVLLSVVIFSVVSYLVADPYMNMMTGSFGLVKCSFAIPIIGVVIIGAGMVLLAFLFAVLQSLRIRRIEAYRMLIAE